MTLNPKIYDTLKWIAQLLLPGLGTLYFALSGIWGLPYGEQVVGTITAIDAFLGMILGISTASFKGDGELVVDTSDPTKDRYLLNVDADLSEIPKRDTIVLKVNTKGSIKPTMTDPQEYFNMSK